VCLHETVNCRCQAVLWSRRGSDVYTQSSSWQIRSHLACRTCQPSAGGRRTLPGRVWHESIITQQSIHLLTNWRNDHHPLHFTSYKLELANSSISFIPPFVLQPLHTIGTGFRLVRCHQTNNVKASVLTKKITNCDANIQSWRTVLWRCWFGGRRAPACKNWVVGCWHGYLSGVRCRFQMAQLMPLPLTISCSSKSRLLLSSWFYLSGTSSPG